MIRFCLAVCLVFSWFGLSLAQDGSDLRQKMQSALQAGQNETALDIAETLYEQSVDQKDLQMAGYAAYAKAQILELQNDAGGAAEAYEDCAIYYGKAKAVAQSLQCQYQSALAYNSIGKTASAIELLKEAGEELDAVGQEKSELAANVYLLLSKLVLPSKLDRFGVAKRKSARTYAEKAMVAFKALGQENSQNYVSALYYKGLALEDDEQFEAAASSYKQAMDIYAKIVGDSDETYDNLSARYRVTVASTYDDDRDEMVPVEDVNGNTFELEIKKKRKIKFPRINRSQLVDGAWVAAKITLSAEGGVSEIKIVESEPSVEFGEAFVKSVKKWKFSLPENVSGEDILPFDYRVTFYVTRR